MSKYDEKSQLKIIGRSKACVCGRSRTGIVASNPGEGMEVLSPVSVVCCQVEVSARGRLLVQRSPTEFNP